MTNSGNSSKAFFDGESGNQEIESFDSDANFSANSLDFWIALESLTIYKAVSRSSFFENLPLISSPSVGFSSKA